MSAISVINQYTNVGFYGAPVSKSLMLFIGCGHAATHVPALQSFRRLLKVDVHNLDSVSQLLRFLPSKLAFPDTRDTLLVLFLIYFFRVFERRYGSLKFSSILLTSFTVSVLLEVAVTWVTGLHQAGPFGLTLPLLVPYYLHVPVLSSAAFGQVSVSSKTLAYLLGLQIAVASSGHLAATACSLLAGLIFCSPIVHKIRLPGWIGRLCDATLGRVFRSSPGEGGGLQGATLEIQRSQQAEAIEQQLMRARNRHNVPIGGRQMRLEEMWGRGQRGAHAAVAPQQPSPQLLQTLVDMGFSRQRAVQALQQAGGDLDQATNILLQDIM